MHAIQSIDHIIVISMSINLPFHLCFGFKAAYVTPRIGRRQVSLRAISASWISLATAVRDRLDHPKPLGFAPLRSLVPTHRRRGRLVTDA